ncbi:hypothetical protein AKO1_007501 [Acrasis kona]|uniref:Ras-related protein Rab n=1 Tax=Acrasis kona TaxID=1008807 RepID=A0AAW2YRG4_9EUKA
MEVLHSDGEHTGRHMELPENDSTCDEMVGAYRVALLEEKKHRMRLQINLNSYTKQMSKLQTQLFEKDQALEHISIKYKQLLESYQTLQDESLLIPSEENARPSLFCKTQPEKPAEDFSSIFHFPNLFNPLVYDTTDKDAFDKAKEEVKNLKADMEMSLIKNDELTAKNKLLTEKVNILERASTNHVKEQQTFKKERTELVKKIEHQTRCIFELEQKNSSAEELIHQNEEELNQLKKDGAQKDENINLLSQKLVLQKEEMSLIKLQLRKFHVTRVRSFFPNQDALVVLHKNPQNGLLMISVEVNNIPLLAAPVASIMHIKPDDANMRRVNMVFFNNAMETFECQDRRDFIETLKVFQAASADDNGINISKSFRSGRIK